MKTIAVVVREIHDMRLREIARQEDRSISWVVRRIFDSVLLNGINEADTSPVDINRKEGGP